MNAPKEEETSSPLLSAEEEHLLIEAAHNYAYKDWREDSLCGIAYYAFKAGAMWQREQENKQHP